MVLTALEAEVLEAWGTWLKQTRRAKAAATIEHYKEYIREVVLQVRRARPGWNKQTHVDGGRAGWLA